jgi:Family of unknown function (DUF5752)
MNDAAQSPIADSQAPAATPATQPFGVKDCALLTVATGRRAENLKELRDNLLTISTDSIYNHFWGGLLQPRFEEREFNNDFAAWVCRSLHDSKLAERLAVIDPTEFSDLELLRQELIEVIEERLDESELLRFKRPEERFEFLCSQIVVFDTHRRIQRPEELADVLPHISASSVFYHFIDARRRSADRVDDFRAWFAGFGDAYADLAVKLAGVDPYFLTLTELRQEVSELFRDHFGSGSDGGPA